MKAVVRFADPAKGCKLLTQAPIKPPPPEHVQIKVMVSPVNPCDEHFCAGRYTPHGKYEPFACGYEGSGIVTELGEGVPKNYLGKRVAFYRALNYTEGAFGVWCQFATLHYTTCVILDDDMSFEDMCGIFINPLTIFGFLEIIRRKGATSIVNTAAASALGKMLIKVCKKEGLDIICIVRRKEQIQMLESLGAKYVLNQTDPDFAKSLKTIAEKLKCKLAFDAVGGDLTAKIFDGMPTDSTIYVYGDLGGEYKGLSPLHFMSGKKTLEGFVLSSSEVYNDPLKFKAAAEYMIDDARKGGTSFKTIVVKKYKLEEYETALKEYKKCATEGKVVICPNMD